MLRILSIIWPALLPALMLLGWYFMKVRHAKKQPEPILPRLRDGPWFFTLMATALIAIACLFIFGLTQPPTKGYYQPAQMDNGVVVPGHIE